MRYRDIELLAKHLRAVQAEPDKAKKCFDPQKSYGAFPLYTPSAEVQALSAGNRSLSGVLLQPPSAQNNPSHIHQGGAGSDQGDSDQQQVAAA